MNKRDIEQALLVKLLLHEPLVMTFDERDIQFWASIGMQPKYFLYNGIQAYRRVIEEFLKERVP